MVPGFPSPQKGPRTESTSMPRGASLAYDLAWIGCVCEPLEEDRVIYIVGMVQIHVYSSRKKTRSIEHTDER